MVTPIDGVIHIKLASLPAFFWKVYMVSFGGHSLPWMDPSPLFPNPKCCYIATITLVAFHGNLLLVTVLLTPCFPECHLLINSAVACQLMRTQIRRGFQRSNNHARDPLLPPPSLTLLCSDFMVGILDQGGEKSCV